MCMFPICSPWLSDSKTVFVFSLALLLPVKVKFYPPKSKGSPLRVKNQKKIGLLILIVQKKGFDALNATQKTPALCKVPFLK